MRIGVFPADLEGCGHYRLIWPAEVMKRLGHDITIIAPQDRSNSFTAKIDDEQVVEVKAPDYDVLVFQRVTHKYLAQAIALMKKQGKAVVVDIDDDLDAIDPSNPAFHALHPKKGVGVQADHSWEWCRVACDNASVVTVSSMALRKRYVQHGRGFIIRNYVPESYLTIPRVPSDVVGWGGSLHSHAADVPMLGWSIQRLMNEGHTFRVVGNGTGITDALSLPRDPEVIGQQSLEQWPHALASLGIGVAPLADTRFNAAKSWLKPLEKAAVGVPTVMSPRAEYRNIHSRRIGVIADSPAMFYKKLKRLIESEDERESLAYTSRMAAMNLTLEQNIHHWVTAWTAAFDKRERVLRVQNPFGLNDTNMSRQPG